MVKPNSMTDNFMGKSISAITEHVGFHLLSLLGSPQLDNTMRTPRTCTLFLLTVAAQIGFKLWLVHRHEVAACDYPYDDPWYVIAATHWYWWGSYPEGAFSRPPAYPLWIALSRSIGLPLRLSTEFLFLAAACAFVLSLLRAGLPKAAAAVVFGLIVFHPFSVYVNDYVLSDSLYGPILLACTAGMIALLARRGNRGLAVWTGLGLAVLWHTRQESPLILLHVALFAVVAAWVWGAEARSGRRIAREIGVTVFIVSTVVAGVSLAVRTLNYVSFGVFADHELAMPGFLDAYGALLRITPERRVPLVSVPRESLKRAYTVSPTFRLLQPYFDGPEGLYWETLSPQNVADKHEIGQFVWPLRAAIHRMGYGNSAADTEAFCRRIAQEIHAACATGQLRCTHVLLGPLALLRTGLPQVRFSLEALGRLLFWRGNALEPRCAWTKTNSSIADLFDIAANRRTALTTDALYIIGWGVGLVDPLRSVSFRDAEGWVVAFTDRLRVRPDLDAGFRTRLAPQSFPLPAAFELRIPVPLDNETGGSLIFTLHSGKTVELAYDELRRVALKHPLTAGSDGSLEYAIEYRQTAQEGRGMEDRALSGLLHSYGSGVIALSFAGLASLLILVSGQVCGAGDRVLYGVVLLLLGLTVSRIVLLAIFYATVWPGDNPRFIYPVAYLYPCAVLVLICCVARGLSGSARKRRTKWRKP